jgi:hypothetical protein
MVIISKERTTGRGAVHYTAVPIGDTWIPLSKVSGRIYDGRIEGFETYSLTVPNSQIYAKFYRSNYGREEVQVFVGDRIDVVYHSFERAAYELKHVTGKSA